MTNTRLYKQFKKSPWIYLGGNDSLYLRISMFFNILIMDNGYLAKELRVGRLREAVFKEKPLNEDCLPSWISVLYKKSASDQEFLRELFAFYDTIFCEEKE